MCASCLVYPAQGYQLLSIKTLLLSSMALLLEATAGLLTSFAPPPGLNIPKQVPRAPFDPVPGSPRPRDKDFVNRVSLVFGDLVLYYYHIANRFPDRNTIRVVDLHQSLTTPGGASAEDTIDLGGSEGEREAPCRDLPNCGHLVWLNTFLLTHLRTCLFVMPHLHPWVLTPLLFHLFLQLFGPPSGVMVPLNSRLHDKPEHMGLPAGMRLDTGLSQHPYFGYLLPNMSSLGPLSSDFNDEGGAGGAGVNNPRNEDMKSVNVGEMSVQAWQTCVTLFAVMLHLRPGAIWKELKTTPEQRLAAVEKDNRPEQTSSEQAKSSLESLWDSAVKYASGDTDEVEEDTTAEDVLGDCLRMLQSHDLHSLRAWIRTPQAGRARGLLAERLGSEAEGHMNTRQEEVRRARLAEALKPSGPPEPPHKLHQTRLRLHRTLTRADDRLRQLGTDSDPTVMDRRIPGSDDEGYLELLGRSQGMWGRLHNQLTRLESDLKKKTSKQWQDRLDSRASGPLDPSHVITNARAPAWTNKAPRDSALEYSWTLDGAKDLSEASLEKLLSLSAHPLALHSQSHTPVALNNHVHSNHPTSSSHPIPESPVEKAETSDSPNELKNRGESSEMAVEGYITRVHLPFLSDSSWVKIATSDFELNPDHLLIPTLHLALPQPSSVATKKGGKNTSLKSLRDQEFRRSEVKLMRNSVCQGSEGSEINRDYRLPYVERRRVTYIQLSLARMRALKVNLMQFIQYLIRMDMPRVRPNNPKHPLS